MSAPSGRPALKANHGERFPTEWSLYDCNEPDGGRQTQQSEGVRPEGRALVSSATETGARNFGSEA
jgi:hypothetical protein